MANLYVIGTEDNETGFVLTTGPQTTKTAKRAIDWQYAGAPITTKFYACTPGAERETFKKPSGSVLKVSRGIYSVAAWKNFCDELWGAEA